MVMMFIMKLIIKIFPEINIKSKYVRLLFIKNLSYNIKHVLRYNHVYVNVMYFWDKIEIFINKNMNHKHICNILVNIPGIQYVLIIEEYSFLDIHDIANQTYTKYKNILEKKTFCVRVKRNGNHNFTSVKAEQYIGNILNNQINSASVKLNEPDITIDIEINNKKFFFVICKLQGLGGFPIGTQGNVLSLISGGFDSTVSSYMLLRRGCRVHYCFFNFGDINHEINVKQIVYYLWHRFGSSHTVKFFSINFVPVITELFRTINKSYINIILKRIMIRIASKIAVNYKIQALATGDSIGQVASQTLINLSLIDNITDHLILRPLISYDKENIINIARDIGTADISSKIPELCGMSLKKPITAAKIMDVEYQEAKFNLAILDVVIKEISIIDIQKIYFNLKLNSVIQDIEIVSIYHNNDVIIDIRLPEEQEKNPLKCDDVEIKLIPFYNLLKEIVKFPKNKTYLLYCQHGVMSRLQANYLFINGINNLKVYIPKK
uniref:tRNA sulfurtransferase n=1 Tax=Candidatus Aschnera chinzeii TaxID=1485666 RepID=A0AAT9G4E6_9ENTR|nr:MAG: tRNA 4-thiouridine(8) synthase ThiI [Candidatus Aschnera chinzeii]